MVRRALCRFLLAVTPRWILGDLFAELAGPPASRKDVEFCDRYCLLPGDSLTIYDRSCNVELFYLQTERSITIEVFDSTDSETRTFLLR